VDIVVVRLGVITNKSHHFHALLVQKTGEMTAKAAEACFFSRKIAPPLPPSPSPYGVEQFVKLQILTSMNEPDVISQNKAPPSPDAVRA
jgi:hypothetical protein